MQNAPNQCHDKVLLGLGLATLVVTNGTPAVTVANVDGVRVAGVLLEAGSKNSESLLQWGQPSTNYAGDTSNPGVASDIYARVGGPAKPTPAQSKYMVHIISSNVIVDNSWLWRADHGSGFSVAPMAVYESGLVIFSTGFMDATFVAVDPRGSGDITSNGIAWRSPPKKAPRMPSLIAKSGQIFAIADNGILRCLDAKTGQILNEKRIGGNFSSSPLLAGGNLYLSSREGNMTVVKCSSDLETMATNRFESSLMASPVLVGDDLLVRTEKKLLRIKSPTP